MPNRSVKIDNKTFERVTQFEYLGKILFVKKLRREWSQGMLAIIRFRIYCFTIFCSEYKDYDKQN